jgi:hypothetical protein
VNVHQLVQQRVAQGLVVQRREVEAAEPDDEQHGRRRRMYEHARATRMQHLHQPAASVPRERSQCERDRCREGQQQRPQHAQQQVLSDVRRKELIVAGQRGDQRDGDGEQARA